MRKPRTKEIKGAKEFIQTVSEPVAEIKEDIAALEQKKSELESRLSNPDSYKLADIEANKDIKIQISMIDEGLSKAQAELDHLLSNEAKHANFKEAQELIGKHKEEVKGNYDDLNKAMIEKIYEVRALYQALKDYNIGEQKQVHDFIDEIEEFIPERVYDSGSVAEQRKYGNASYKQVLQGEVSMRHLGKYRPLTAFFDENAYRVDGLLEPKPEYQKPTTRGTASAWNKRFDVNPMEYKESADKGA